MIEKYVQIPLLVVLWGFAALITFGVIAVIVGGIMEFITWWRER